MMKRDVAPAPTLGERVAHIMIKARARCGRICWIKGIGLLASCAVTSGNRRRLPHSLLYPEIMRQAPWEGVQAHMAWMSVDTSPARMRAQGAKGAKSWEKAEDPIYALEHGLPIDCQHYLDHFLEKPLSRLFGPIMRNPKDLMSGARPAFTAVC